MQNTKSPARKQGEPKLTTRTMSGHGQAQNGNEKNESTSKPTRYVAFAEIKVKYPIIPTSKSTESQNISISPILNLTVTSAIEVDIKGAFSVPSVRSLGRSERVSHAISALIQALKTELSSNTSNSTEYEASSSVRHINE